MFELEGEQYSLEQVTSAAEQSNMSLDDYLNKYNIKKLEKTVKTVEKLDGAAKKDADVVPVATPSRASIISGVQPKVTESPSVDTSLELQDPKPKKSRRAQVRAKELARRKEALEWQKEQDRIADSIEDLEYKEALKGVDQTLSKAGSSIWSYSPENISNLYSKTTGESLDYKTILNTGSSSASYTGIFNPYNSYLTGGFSYYDFANEEKINGISISELQKIDQANAASSVLESIIEKHGDKSDDFVVDQGQVILKGKDKKLQELYSSLRTATAEEKQGILDQIKTTREDDSQELFDINTGNLVKYDKLPEESKKDYDTIIEKAEEKASTTELGQLKKELTNSYSNLVGISKRISSFVDENGEYEITKGSHTLQGYLVNLVKDFFGSEETTYGDLSRVQQIANTGVLPENVSKISGEHPLVKAYNTALQEYAILNQAVQTNTDPLSEKQEGFWESIGDALIEKVDMTGGVAAPKVKANANQIFVESLRNAGLSGINQDEVDEAVSQNWRSVIGGGTIDLSLLIGELYASKKLTGNKVQKGFKWLSKAFNNSKAAKSSKIVRKTGNMLLKGGEEMTVFEVLETGKTGLGLSKQSTREEDFARRQFAFSLGIGNSLGSTILRAMPAKSIFSPILAQLSKSDLARSAGNRFVNANAGAFSFEFARAMTAALGKDEEGYFDRSPEEFVLGYVTEGAKMGLLGAKSIFHKNGIYRSFQRDLRLLNLNPTYVNNAAKRTGINPNSVRKPGEETINEIDAARADKMSGIDAKLKTQQITKEQAKKEIDAANKDYNILEAEAELNLAKERVKAEDKSALKPTDESVRILINKMKKGQKFNDKDNNALVNTPLPIIYDRMGIDPSTKSLEGRWNREFAIEDIMNNNTSFKAPYGSKERAESYKFIDEAFEIGGEMQLLKRLDNRTEEQEKQLQQLEKDYKVYEPGGYKYDRLQDKLDELYLKQRLANKAQAEDVLGATKEGESVSIRSAQDFQEKYNSIKKDGQDVTSSDGFYDAKNKIFYINEEVVAATRNTTVDKHEVGHFVLRDSLKDKTGKVTDEGIKVIDEVLNELTPKQRETVQKRIDDFYRYDETELNSLKSKLKLALNEGKAEEAESITEEINKLNSKPKKERNKKDYYEEYLTVLSDAINDKQIVFKENVGNAFEKFVPFLRKKMPELELNANTGKNLFELIKSYSKGEKAGIEAAKEMSIAAEGKDTSGQQVSESISKRSIELKEQLEDLKDREFELEQGDFDAQKSNLELKIRQAEKSEARDESESIKTTAVEKIKPVKKLGIIDEIVEKATAQKLEAPIVSDKNKKIASVNEDIVKEMTALGANKVSEIKDKDVRQSIVDRLGRNNVGAVTELAKKAAFKGKDLAIDEELKVGYDEFIGGFSAELSALINSYKANVNGKKVPFGAYMNQNLPLRYPAILRKSLEGKLKKSESLSSDKNIKKQVASIESDSNDFELGGKDDSSEELIVDQIDVRKFGPARDKVDEISKIVEVEKGERPSYKDLANKYLDQVSMELFNVPGKKIKGGATLKDSEAKSLQALFINPNNVRKLFKTMPPYNVAGSETTIGEQGETIGVSKDVKGKSIGLSNKFMIKFYQPVTRAIPGISSPKGRSLGLTSQGQVHELKPEFRGRITNEAIKDIQRSVGVTEKGVPSEKISDANRSKYGTTLTGFAKAYVANVINVTGRSKQTDKQEQADTGAGKASIMFSMSAKQVKELKKRGYENIGKDYFSKVPKNVLPYLVKLNTVTQKGAIAKALEDISENLDEQSYNDLYNKWFKPYVELKYVRNKENWPSSEQDILRNVKSLAKSGKVEGLRSIQDNINKDSSKLDVVFEIDGQDVAVEVKKTADARLGQIHLHNEFGKTYVNKLSEEFASKIIEGDDQSSKVKLIEFLEKNYPSEIRKEKNKRGEDIYIVTDGAYGAAIRRKALKNSRHKIKLPITLVSDLYNNKGGNYIQFGDMGTFYMGKNKMSFNVASLEQINPKTKKLIDVDVTYMWKAYQRADGTKSLKRVAVPQLTTESRKILSKTKTLNIGTESQLESMLKSPGYKPSTPFSKSKKAEKAKSLDKAFNDIIENKTGIPSRKRYGIVEATTKGVSKGKFNFFIPPSAEDFVGLLYPTLGKGKVGDSQMQWYKDNLITPYAKAMNKLSQARVYILNNYKSLKNQLGVVPKDLSKKVEGTDYTKEMAVRVYIWNKQKMNVPGISKSDIRKLSKFVADNENLQTFGDQLINLQLGDGYIKPKEGWAAGTITTDILEGLNTTKRSKYLKEWQENADVIFSEDNMNKLQAVYGLNYVKAMKNMLGRMKSGRNRNFPGDSATGRFTDWVTGSVGVTMFLNTRSAVLQTIYAINFINFTDNNILTAGKAFANQPQYWKDFMMLMNSDFLKERRGGLRINVSEADIADMAKKGGVRGAISKLLELGFAPTQIADSFAIASGGSTFYRNRVNTYKKQGLTEKQAEKKAFEDFRETAEESQQSSRADRISMQQASPVGRFVLAFANTPAQYARIIKKAASDLKNGRGDRKTNISKIIYYGAAQNLLFNALQQALFATALDDEEPKDKEKEKKYLNIANGMMDSLLRGTGIGGSVVSVGKNAVIKLVRELEKDRPKIQNVASELLKISPPVSAKYSRLVQAGKSYDWNKDEMKEKGLSLDNPAYLAGSQVVSALTNIPLDRAIKKANNVVSATSQDLETWERLALLGGWQDWELGIDKEDKKPKIKTRSTKKVRKKIIKKKLETKLIE